MEPVPYDSPLISATFPSKRFPTCHNFRAVSRLPVPESAASRSQGTSGNSPRSRDALELAWLGRWHGGSLTGRLGNLPDGTTTIPHAARNETFQSRAR